MPSRKSVASLLVLACFAVTGVAHAEVTGVKLTLSPYAGLVLWDQIVKYEDKPIYGGRAGLWFGRYIAVEGTYGYCPTRSSASPPQNSKITHLGGDLVIHLTPPHDVTPYVLGGWSRLRFDPEQTVGGKQSFDGWEAAIGIKAILLDRMLLRLEGRDVMIKRDAPLSTNWAHNFVVTAGLDFLVFGHVVDSDHDGVSDRHDKCPNTPIGCKVDKNGCPIDSDGDGVCDGVDQCSNTPKGCKVDARGCPIDSDGDGVCDGLDQCPNTPAGAKVDTRGCPIVVSEKETQLLDTGLLRLNNVTFDTGKAILKPES